jgi:hypothetical protein
MVIVRCTRKLLQRVGPPAKLGPASTTLLGDWYGTYLPWRPRQVALFVNERTLLPVLVPLAPAGTLLGRFPDQFAAVLAAHQIPESVASAEVAATREAWLSTTSNRSVVGSMNEFAFLAEANRRGEQPVTDLVDLSVKLARTPCGPLYNRHVSPDRELRALLGELDD